jgi:hypothetical protein
MHMEFRWGNLWKVTAWKTKTTGLHGKTSTHTYAVWTGVIKKLLARRPGRLLFGADFIEYFRQVQK